MPQTFQFDVHREQLERAQAELHLSLGYVMNQWAHLERVLFYWFLKLTRMQERMARAIFYSARGFAARAEMLEAAIEYASDLSAAETAFLQEAVIKARLYSSFRNKMAHGEPRLHVIGLQPVRELHYTITQAKQAPVPGEVTLSIEDIFTAVDNIGTLTKCIAELLPLFKTPQSKSPEEYLALVAGLPKEPHVPYVPTAAKQPPSPQEPVHRNKKEYRAAQAAQKPPTEGA